MIPQATIHAPETLYDDGWHNAFTDLTWWHGQIWCGFRRAPTHGIVPPGAIHLMASASNNASWASRHTISQPNTDLRDPRFLATSSTLYCLCAGYHPRPGATSLSSNAAENTIQTYITSTRDGQTWSPLVPILRPNYWGWSSLVMPGKRKPVVFVAAYHTGMSHTETSSIALFAGDSFATLFPLGIIYDGSDPDLDGAPHYQPAEPLLFEPQPGILGCCVRTEGAMDLGVAVPPYQPRNWRWRDTRARIHPSGTAQSRYGTLLVGRGWGPATGRRQESPFAGAWMLTGTDPVPLGTFQSTGDCAYAGIIPLWKNDPFDEDSYLVSYYTQRPTVTTLADPSSSAVQLAEIRLMEPRMPL